MKLLSIDPLKGEVGASRIEAVVEVCGDAALYFAPEDRQGVMEASRWKRAARITL
ncbi:hypothetical protein MYX84_01255 [Acidobacteria bacterium AH-259-O06]|nr:hypothetical protein [Acidobacteria bacterium AH-259-O06]